MQLTRVPRACSHPERSTSRLQAEPSRRQIVQDWGFIRWAWQRTVGLRIILGKARVSSGCLLSGSPSNGQHGEKGENGTVKHDCGCRDRSEQAVVSRSSWLLRPAAHEPEAARRDPPPASGKNTHILFSAVTRLDLFISRPRIDLSPGLSA